tara:strand:- start:218 stop:472 length:255 start_codon:yes stop_codon:yes gene_type:complete
MFKKTRAKFKKKLKELWNVDSMIDLIVDLLLVVFDVLYSPILIIVRILRHFFNEWIVNSIKRFLKWFAHKVLRIPEVETKKDNI